MKRLLYLDNLKVCLTVLVIFHHAGQAYGDGGDWAHTPSNPGADATGCVKSTCFNMAKAGYTVHVLSNCVTSYDLKKLPEMFAYYESKGCEVKTLADYK